MGMLTAEGALQLVKLGTYLHESFLSTGLFDSKLSDLLSCYF